MKWHTQRRTFVAVSIDQDYLVFHRQKKHGSSKSLGNEDALPKMGSLDLWSPHYIEYEHNIANHNMKNSRALRHI